MLSRFTIFSVSLCIVITLPASGMSIPPRADVSLEKVALCMKKKDFGGAREAVRSVAGPGQEFLAGMAAYKAEAWEEAAASLGRGAETYPLLADYALAAQGEALYRLGRFSEALVPLDRLLTRYPDSPMHRQALLLYADAQNEKGDFAAAIAAYQKFIERYPAGSDALTALYKSALCRDLRGETATAIISLRQIWLNSPASSLAPKAEAALQTIAARGVPVPPYTAEELYRRAVALYDLRKYSQAITALKAVPVDGQSDDFKARILLKTGQAYLKNRQYRETEQTLLKLQEMKVRKGILDEGSFWYAKALDKNGRDDAAAAAFLQLVERAPASELADDALMEAAYVRKWQKRDRESIDLFKRLVQGYPRSDQRNAADWEIAWLSYRGGDRATAATAFRRLTEIDAYREKSLYWYGQTLTAAGDAAGAAATFKLLLAEYPLGFYALSYRTQTKTPLELPGPVPSDPRQLLPLPEGFDRVKALISFGLLDEARKELSASKKKQASLPALARLYLEMDDFNAAFNTLSQERGKGLGKAAYALALSYPVPFRDAVQQNATACSIDENLVYAVMRAESSFLPTALSPVGAIGLMQLMPTTAATVLKSASEKECRERLTVPADNITAGTRHLKDLVSSYKGNTVAVIAAYNAGSGNVNKWLKSFGNLPREEFIESIPFGETREYVKKVLAAADIYSRLYRAGTVTVPEAVVSAPAAVETAKPAAAVQEQASSAGEAKELPPTPEVAGLPTT